VRTLSRLRERVIECHHDNLRLARGGCVRDSGDMGWFLAVLFFAVTMSITPGPNNFMVTAAAANFGFRPTVPHILGISIGFPVMIVLLGIGPGLALTQHPDWHAALKLVGGAYMLFLSWKIATASAPGGGNGEGRPLSFLQAAAFQWLNPKAWGIALGAITAYTNVGGRVLLETLIIGAVFAPVCVLCVSFWAWGGVAIGQRLRSPPAIRRFNIAMAVLLIVSLVPLFV
jgi:threonine/homoserine/homoserine lactone efflux protein